MLQEPVIDEKNEVRTGATIAWNSLVLLMRNQSA